MKFLSDPKSVTAPETYALRKPKLAKTGLPRPNSKFSQPSGVPKFGRVMPPHVKMVPISALAPHVSIPKIQRTGK